MTWSFDSTAPFGTAKDEIRTRIGDTSSSAPFLSDEQISGLVTAHAGTLYAAAAAARTIAGQLARQVNTREGSFSIDASQGYKSYMNLAKTLKQEASLAGGVVYLGGQSVSDKLTQEQDTDRVEPAFRVDMFAHRTQSSSS